MTVKRSQVGWVFWLWWVLASTVGMIIGLFMAFIVVALINDVVGEFFSILVYGIVLGIGVGILQWLVLRRRVSRVGLWVLTNAAGGYGIALTGFEGFSESLSFGTLLAFTGVAALGGAVTGTLQRLVLRGQVSRAGWWVSASTVGWGLGVTVARALPRGVGDMDTVWAMVVIAAVLGVVTGGALVWLLRQPVPEA